MKAVTLTTSSRVQPPSASAASRLSFSCRFWVATSSPYRKEASVPSCPLRNRNPFARTPTPGQRAATDRYGSPMICFAMRNPGLRGARASFQRALDHAPDMKPTRVAIVHPGATEGAIGAGLGAARFLPETIVAQRRARGPREPRQKALRMSGSSKGLAIRRRGGRDCRALPAQDLAKGFHAATAAVYREPAGPIPKE